MWLRDVDGNIHNSDQIKRIEADSVGMVTGILDGFNIGSVLLAKDGTPEDAKKFILELQAILNGQPVPKIPTWSDKPPIRPGWYWWRDRGNSKSQRVVCVFRNDGDLRVEQPGEGHVLQLSQFDVLGCEWGPEVEAPK